MRKFGEKLRVLRKKKGLTTRELGDLLTVHQTHISQLETGRKVPNAAMILKIADLFGVTTDLLMRDEIQLDRGSND